MIHVNRASERAHILSLKTSFRFDGRREALASAHTLLSESRWEGTDLAELVRTLLAPYGSEGSSRYRLEGERVVLPPRTCDAL